ncbi:polyprotein, partial [Phytophthora megakarya]
MSFEVTRELELVPATRGVRGQPRGARVDGSHAILHQQREASSCSSSPGCGPTPHPRGSTLGGGEIDCAIPDSGDKSATQPPPSAISSSALAVASANAVTRSQTRKILGTLPDAALPIAAWTKRTLINPSAASPTAQPASSANYTPIPSARPIDTERVEDFDLQRQAIDRYVRDALQAAVDRQKLNADKRGRKNMTKETGDRVLLSTEGIRDSAVTNLGASKLAPRFIGPFKIIKHIGDSYTLKIPPSIRLHPTFYVGRLKKYLPATIPASSQTLETRASVVQPDAQLGPTLHLPHLRDQSAVEVAGDAQTELLRRHPHA